MSIYLYRNNKQEGPFEESAIRELLQTGSCSPSDLAIREGLFKWQPLSSILDLQVTAVASLPIGRLQNEIALLDNYSAEIGNLIDNLAECDSQTAKHLQIQLDQKMQIYWKQIYLVRTQFSDEEQGIISEAKFYAFQALITLFSAGMMRRMSDRSESLAFGLASGLIAKQQEKKNAQQAIALLDKALEIYDFAMIHTIKADVYQILGDNQSALYELNYVISNFPDDELYIQARQMKDAIENPPKKGMCFVATAAFGSPLAPEVVFLSRYRDEVLLKSKAGALFVKIYYRVSPPLAKLIARVKILRTIVRNLFLTPLLRVLKATKFK